MATPPPDTRPAAKPNRRRGVRSGRPAEDRTDPISFYVLRTGLWTCRCGHVNKTIVETCPGEKKVPCGRPAPYLRFAILLPLGIATKFKSRAERRGISMTAAAILALSEEADKT